MKGDVQKKARNTKGATQFCLSYKGMNSPAPNKGLVTVVVRKGITCEVTPNVLPDPRPFGMEPPKCRKIGLEIAWAARKGKEKERGSQARGISESVADPMLGHPLPKRPAPTGPEAMDSASMAVIAAIPTMALKLERKGRMNWFSLPRRKGRKRENNYHRC